jgi:excisionase family DNA binding protein
MANATYNIQQAATLMGVDRGTVRDWVNSGQLPATRDGREWRIPMPFVFYIAAVLKFERSAEPRYVLDDDTSSYGDGWGRPYEDQYDME